MRHRRRVARFFSTDDNNDDDDDDNDDDDDGDDSSRTLILLVSTELADDSIFLIPLFIHPLSFILFIELTRNRDIHGRLSLIRESFCAGHERSRSRSIAIGQVKLTCDKLAFLIRIFEQSIKRDVDSAEFMEGLQSRYANHRDLFDCGHS